MDTKSATARSEGRRKTGLESICTAEAQLKSIKGSEIRIVDLAAIAATTASKLLRNISAY
jgi:hypothetical protein